MDINYLNPTNINVKMNSYQDKKISFNLYGSLSLSTTYYVLDSSMRNNSILFLYYNNFKIFFKIININMTQSPVDVFKIEIIGEITYWTKLEENDIFIRKTKVKRL